MSYTLSSLPATHGFAVVVPICVWVPATGTVATSIVGLRTYGL
jgi:hypothetical protein